MSHTCHAIGCSRQVPPRLLFCGPHWRKTPRAEQELIWATYVEGQEVRKDPTGLYLVAQSLVVQRLAVREGRVTREVAADATLEVLRHVLEADALTSADLDVLAKHEPTIFGPWAERVRAAEGRA